MVIPLCHFQITNPKTKEFIPDVIPGFIALSLYNDYVGSGMYREWKKVEFLKEYYNEFGNNKIER
jgi:hypothetical protein